MTTPDGDQPSLEARLERAERLLGALAAELSSLRAEVRGAPHALPPASLRPEAQPEARAQPAPRAARPSLDIEQLVGRYGILVIAVVAAVAAVGTFLDVAIARGWVHLGPAARVIIGLGAAAALGAWGVRLRKRERSFGSSMLGLALVIVEVCAWASGPKFHLVPSPAAFAGAALVSWALALFAHAENDEPLWCVAFGGAALAPFVTSDGGGNVLLLLAYGLIVLLPACFAISHRDWSVAWSLFYVATGVYCFTGASLVWQGGVGYFAAAFGFPFIIMVAGIVPFAPESRKRGAMRWLAVLAVVVGLAEHAVTPMDRALLVAGFLAAAVLWLALIDRHAAVEQSTMVDSWRSRIALLDWFDAAVIPLALVAQGANVRGLMLGAAAAVYAAGALCFVPFAWRRAVNSLRDAAAGASVLCAVFAVVASSPEQPLALTALLVAIALASLAAHTIRPSVSWVAGCAGVLAIAGALVIDALAARPVYQYTPFVTEPSAAAFVITIALIAVARLWHALRVATRTAMGARPEWSYARNARLLLRGATLAPWAWGFVWVLLELSRAFSASTATLLLVTYFAATGVAAVAAGRARRSARLRQTGLVLAIIAAATAFYGASSYFDFSARIAAYLVTSAFLLGIAYWYRRPGAAAAESAAAA